MSVDLDLRQLRYFVIVAEELNFTRAAERLQIAQPPLSRQIQSLEKNLGVELLERNNRRVNLTPAGTVFLAECYQILSQAEYSVKLTQRVASGELGQLTLGFEGATRNHLILKIIREFRVQYPDVELIIQEMASGKQIDALQQGRIDLGLIEPIAATTDVDMTLLLVEPLMVALDANHALTQQAHLRLAHLANEPWVTGRSGCGCGLLMRIEAACRQAGFLPRVQQETNDLQMTLSFVASGLGITLLPESSALDQEGIVYRPLEPPVPETQLAIAWRSSKQSPLVKSFLHGVAEGLEARENAKEEAKMGAESE